MSMGARCLTQIRNFTSDRWIEGWTNGDVQAERSSSCNKKGKYKVKCQYKVKWSAQINDKIQANEKVNTRSEVITRIYRIEAQTNGDYQA